MASPAPGRGKPDIGPFYVKMTDGSPKNGLPGARDIFGNLSLTSQFKLSLHLTNQDADAGGTGLMKWLSDSDITRDNRKTFLYDFYCAEAIIPGAQFDVTEEMGSRQGTIERFPTRRIFPEFTVTFYVDNRHQLIRLFEEWMNYINPLYTNSGEVQPSSKGQGNAKNTPDFFRLRYPSSYKRIISIVKFERDFNTPNPNQPGGVIQDVPRITYRLIDAFPTNIAAMPVTYEGSTITKTIVTFSYSRYVIEKHNVRR
jgi:hypothetical protein